jgi:Flp pilus assembly protein TadG
MKGRDKIRQANRGNAVVEMAISVPILLMMVMEAIDFGRLFFEGMVVKNASHVSAFYGAQEMRYAGDTDGIRSAARSEAADSDSFTASHEMICQCLGASGAYDTGSTQATCGEADCGACDAPRVYIKTRTEKNFSTMGWYPGVPQTTPIAADGWVRVQ